MSSCHDTTDPKAQLTGILTVALAGNPNSGKTTIFNALTGLRQKVANYPGVTVEKKTGRCRLDDGTKINIIDLPGTYSLISRSPDEVVAMEVLRGLRKDTPAPDAVIVVVDASNLQRNLYLVSQLIELGRPMVIALNMMDIAQRRGINLSPERLSEELGVPVVAVVGNKHQGITPMKEAIRNARVAKLPDWPLPAAMKAEIAALQRELSRSRQTEPSGSAAGSPPSAGFVSELNRTSNVERRTSNVEVSGEETTKGNSSLRSSTLDVGRSTFDLIPSHQAERLLIGDTFTDLADLARRDPVASLVADAKARLKQLDIDPMQADIEAHYQWIDGIAAGALIPACAAIGDLSRSTSLAPIVIGGTPPTLDYQTPPKVHFSDKLDRILIHKVWGLVIFSAVMATLFISIFWLAQPIMNAMQSGINWVGDLAVRHIGPGPLHDLIHDGIFGGVGTVLVFLPQIALLFFFLAILEDSGYLARAAFLMDRLLSKVGLHGKSFIPLLSSFACAIPGIMATRTIENRKDRLATILVAPFMSCSARLPVYTLLIGTFFASLGPIRQAGIMLACYVLGIVAAVVTALFFKRTFLKGMPSSFILEMPTYKWPQASIVARQVWSNSKQFVTKAGTTILALSVILWALAYYPRLPADKAPAEAKAVQAHIDELNAALSAAQVSAPSSNGGNAAAGVNATIDTSPIDQVIKGLEDDRDNYIAAAQSEYSLAGRFGHAMEPVIRPLGYDWKMGVGLVAAFAAREVFVSTESIVNATGGDTDTNGTKPLAQAMAADRYTTGPNAGKPVWTPLVAVSMLIWFVLAMQCMSTVAIVRRETGGWGWPIFMIVYMNGLAYVVCLAVFQIGKHVFSCVSL
jgi:ferrous iron transport protein B